MLRFNIFGIPVTVQPFFWITLVIIGAGSSGDGKSLNAIFHLALFLIAGFISILVHELGHALTARKFGAQCHIVLQAFGGYAAYTGIPMTRKQRFCITAAGPGLQALLGLVVLVIARFAHPLQPDAAYFLNVLIFISWIWALFNLLPIIPLDGGRMVEATLGPQRITITLWVSIITASIIGFIALTSFGGIGKILIPAFFGYYAWQAWKALPQNRLK